MTPDTAKVILLSMVLFQLLYQKSSSSGSSWKSSQLYSDQVQELSGNVAAACKRPAGKRREECEGGDTGTDRWARRTRAFHNQTTEGAQLLTPGFCQNSENILMTHFLLQPCLVPFLKKSLPYLQQSLAMRELTIEGVNPPNASQVLIPMSTLKT